MSHVFGVLIYKDELITQPSYVSVCKSPNDVQKSETGLRRTIYYYIQGYLSTTPSAVVPRPQLTLQVAFPGALLLECFQTKGGKICGQGHHHYIRELFVIWTLSFGVSLFTLQLIPCTQTIWFRHAAMAVAKGGWEGPGAHSTQRERGDRRKPVLSAEPTIVPNPAKRFSFTIHREVHSPLGPRAFDTTFGRGGWPHPWSYRYSDRVKSQDGLLNKKHDARRVG